MSLAMFVPDEDIIMADTRAYGGSNMPIGSKLKVNKTKSGPNNKPGFVAITSRVVGIDSLIRPWFDEGCDVDSTLVSKVNECGGFEALYVEQKTSQVYVCLNWVHMTGPLEFPEGAIMTIGSETDYLQGVYDVIGDPLESFKRSVAYDKWSDFPIRGFNVKTGKAFTITE